jgi:hypothetical protein
VWRRGGFVSLESKGGVCRTRAVRLASNRMTANFKRLDGDGRMKVAAFAQDGKLLATANVAGDGTRQRLDFSRALPVDEPIELQFEITRGALYSVEVE